MYPPPELAAQLAEHLGEEALSEREIAVLKLVADGNRNRKIGERLFITEETVKVIQTKRSGRPFRERPDPASSFPTPPSCNHALRIEAHQ